MRRFAWFSLSVMALGASVWLLARPTDGGDATLPWHGPLTSLYWQARMRGELPPLWCRWFPAAPGYHPMQEAWGSTASTGFAASLRPTRLAYLLGRVPVRAPAMCLSREAANGRTVRVDMDGGQVIHLSRYFSGPPGPMETIADSIRHTLDTRFGPAARCWSRVLPRGYDQAWVWRTPDYTLALATWRPQAAAQADGASRVELAAVLTRHACRAVPRGAAPDGQTT